jgi:hypothetical protein
VPIAPVVEKVALLLELKLSLKSVVCPQLYEAFKISKIANTHESLDTA